MVRGKKKPAFLKVFERSGERDNRPLLDLGGGSFHDDGPSPFAAPAAMLNSDNEQEDGEDDEFATDFDTEQTSTTSQNNTRAEATDAVEAKRNPYAETAEASARNGDCCRVGELPTKPGRGIDGFAKQEPSRRGFFGSRKGNPLATSSADSDSLDSEGDYRFKAAVTTTESDDDANTFVQFTLEAVTQTSDHRVLGSVEEDEDEDKVPDMFQSMDKEENVQDLFQSVDTQFAANFTENENPPPKQSSNDEEGDTTPVSKPTITTRPRPRLAAAGKSMSCRSLAEHLEKDKPSVDEEVRKVLNIKGPLRPGMGARQKSVRSLKKDFVPERQPSKRGLMKKAISERNFGSASSGQVINGGGILETEPATESIKPKHKGAPVASPRRGRLVTADKRKVMKGVTGSSHTESMEAALSKDSDDLGNKTPSFHKSKAFSDHSGQETREIAQQSGASTPPTTPPTEADGDEHKSPKMGTGATTGSKDLARDSERKEDAKLAESPKGSARRSRVTVPKSPGKSSEKSPSRKTRKLPHSNGSSTSEKTKDGSIRGERIDAERNESLPAAPALSPKRPRSPRDRKGKRRSSTGKKEAVISWSRSPERSSPSSSPRSSPRRLDSPTSTKLFVSQMVDHPPLPESKDDDALVELTDGEGEDTKQTRRKPKNTPGVFVSNFLGSDHTNTQEGSKTSNNVIASPEQEDLTKDFTKHAMAPAEQSAGEEEQKYLRRKLDETMARLEDARRLVSRLEEEVADLTQKLQKSESC